MLKMLYVLIVVAGGLVAGLQATMNADLSKRVGALESSFVTFAGGATLLLLLTLLFGSGKLNLLAQAPKWQLTGGAMGVIIMASIIFGIPVLGAGPAILASIAGQLLLGMAVDHFGLFGVTRTPFGALRAAGVLMMLVSVLIVVGTQAKTPSQ